jgi:hypothetical protein
MLSTTETRFARLHDDSWGVLVADGVASPGDVIAVPKRNGGSREVTLGEQVDARWQSHQGATLFRIAPKAGAGGGEIITVTEPGVFETDDGIFVVKRTRDGERVYAKKLVDTPDRVSDYDGSHLPFDFEYAAGAIAKLSEDDRMPFERAKKLAIRYGRCINCGRRLKAAESVEAGIGPVCRKRFAL